MTEEERKPSVLQKLRSKQVEAAQKEKKMSKTQRRGQEL